MIETGKELSLNRDKFYMQKAIELARKGEGYTGSNPLVGAVVVKDNQIVGCGYHKYYGGPHAEVYALDEAGEDARDAELFVNLEPCCHQGKTGPCSLKVINSGVSRVVIGMQDPHSAVDGGGVDMLARQGIEVKTGVLEEKCRRLNEIFIKYMTEELPFVILKAAQTLDGFLGTSTGDSRWITNEKARLYGHRLRHRTEAILVGVGTILSDDPSLTARLPDKKSRDGLRVILDPGLKTPPGARIINQQSEVGTLLVTGKNISREKMDLFREKKDVEFLQLKLKESGIIPLRELLEKLHQREVSSVLIEGGGRTNYYFLQEKLIDKAYVFLAPRVYGGADGVSVFSGTGPEEMSAICELKNVEYEYLDTNLLIKGYFRKQVNG